MSIQREIVQASDDETEMIEWLGKRCDLVCLPAGSLAPQEEVFELGMCDARNQIIFPRKHAPMFLGSIIKLPGGSYMVEREIAQGLSFEWTRTPVPERGVVTVDSSARIYYLYNPTWIELCDDVQRLVRGLASHIVTSYPVISTDYPRHPIYIGRHMVQRLADGGVSLLYPRGQQVPLGPNPRFR